MAISFAGARRYKKHCGSLYNMNIKKPIPSPMHFFPLCGVSSVVKKGDIVLCGQKIADADSFDVCPTISGCSGKVVYVDDKRIEIENDMLFAPVPHAKPVKHYNELTTREILWILREGGVYEPRYSKPLHVLLAEKNVRECIIVCCFNSDPYVSSPQAAAFGNADKIKRAVEICMRLSGITRAYVAVESDTRKTYAEFKAILRYNDTITPILLKPRYPQSHSDILIKTVTGRENTSSLILSPETLLNMINVLETYDPVTEKIVTVSGDEILEPENFSVPIGATAASVIEGGGYSAPEYLFANGVVEGDRLTDFDTPVTCETVSYTAFNEKKNIPPYRKKLL